MNRMGQTLRKTQNTLQEKMGNSGFCRVFFSHCLYALLYSTFLFLYEVHNLQALVAVIHPVFIAWGCLLIAYDVLVAGIWREMPYKWLLAAFALSSLATALIAAPQVGIVDTMKSWVMTVLPFGVFYPLFFVSKNRWRDVVICSLGVLGVTLVSSAVGLYLFMIRFIGRYTLFGISEPVGILTYINGDGSRAIVLKGIYRDSNHAATFALISILLSVTLLWMYRTRKVEKGRKVLTVIAIVNIVVQLCYLPLANSRGAYLALLAAGGIVCFLFFMVAFRTKMKPAIRVIVSLLLPAVFFAVFYVGLLGIRTGLDHISFAISESRTAQVTQQAPSAGDSSQQAPSAGDSGQQAPSAGDSGQQAPSAGDSGQQAPSAGKDGNDGKQDTFKKVNDSLGAGRVDIWKDALRLYVHNPIMGISPVHNDLYAQRYGTESLIANGKAMHNSYLDLLVDYGAIGFLLMMAFLISAAVGVVKYYIHGPMTEKTVMLTFMMVMAALPLSSAFLLSCMFISTTAMAYVCLFPLSYLVSSCGPAVGKRLSGADRAGKKEANEGKGQ